MVCYVGLQVFYLFLGCERSYVFFTGLIHLYTSLVMHNHNLDVFVGDCARADREEHQQQLYGQSLACTPLLCARMYLDGSNLAGIVFATPARKKMCLVTF